MNHQYGCTANTAGKKENWSSTKSRWCSKLVRATLCLAVASGVLALTPRNAEAMVLICYGGGPGWTIANGCFYGGATCGDWGTMPPGWTCAGAVAFKPNTALIRDRSGRASVDVSGKLTYVMSDNVETALRRFTERSKEGGNNKQAAADFERAFTSDVKAGGGKVSRERLEAISKEANLPIKP